MGKGRTPRAAADLSLLAQTTHPLGWDEEVLRVAMATLLLAGKDSAPATRRCRRRVRRAIACLETPEGSASEPFDRPGIRTAAVAWLHQRCVACGKCEGA